MTIQEAEEGLTLQSLPRCKCGVPAEMALVNTWKSTLGGEHKFSGTWGLYCAACAPDGLKKAQARQQHPNIAKALSGGDMGE